MMKLTTFILCAFFSSMLIGQVPLDNLICEIGSAYNYRIPIRQYSYRLDNIDSIYVGDTIQYFTVYNNGDGSFSSGGNPRFETKRIIWYGLDTMSGVRVISKDKDSIWVAFDSVGEYGRFGYLAWRVSVEYQILNEPFITREVIAKVTTVLPAPPKAQFDIPHMRQCLGIPFVFRNTTRRLQNSWHWSFPGGQPSSYVGKDPPPVHYARPGNYDVTLVSCNEYGCDTFFRAGYAQVVSSPPAGTFSLLQATEGETVRLRACVQGQRYRWEGQPQNLPFIDTVATTSQYYLLEIDNGDEACASTCTYYIYVNPLERNCFLPNVFTPNGDETNDFFIPQCTPAAKILEFQVFDRWGTLVFSSKNDPWDGNINGEEAPSDVYVYRAVYEFDNYGSTEQLKGDVLLLR